MIFDVALNGRVRAVGITSGGGPGRFAVTIDGHPRTFDAVWIDDDTLSLIEGSTVREVRIEARPDGALETLLGSRRLTVVVSQEKRRGPRTRAGGMPGSGRGASVKSPMPGRVVRVLVAAGDRVRAAQPLVVVEAMKMENELRSPSDGVVTRVGVDAGASVDAGAVLVVIE